MPGEHLGAGQNAPWFLSQRIRRMMEDKGGMTLDLEKAEYQATARFIRRREMQPIAVGMNRGRWLERGMTTKSGKFNSAIPRRGGNPAHSGEGY